MKYNLRDKVKVSAVGLAMGIAETIPGVSGGTLAFIFKIYQELIMTIKSFNSSTIGLLIKGRFAEFYKSVNGLFLSFLLGGMGIGIVIGVFGISFLLENYPLPLWSFFFGLVLASAVFLSRDIKWDTASIVFFILGALISFFITLITPTQGSTNLFIIMLSGIIAISALMLPGISGSFILLLLGMYSTVIGAVKEFLSSPGIGQNIYIIITFGVGCLIGLFTFSRVLSFTFKRYFHSTMAVMIGILIGSLNKLWPWRIPIQVMDKSTGEFKLWNEASEISPDNIQILTEDNLLPSAFSQYGDSQLILCIVSFILGIILISVISLKKTSNSPVEP